MASIAFLMLTTAAVVSNVWLQRTGLDSTAVCGIFGVESLRSEPKEKHEVFL